MILYELLSGRRAFSRSTAPESLAAILNEDPPDLSTNAAPIPPALVRIVNRCLEKNPSDRFQTASDLAFALDGLSEGTSGSPVVVGAPRRLRAWIGWSVGAALLVAMLASLAYQYLREQPAAASPVRFQIPPTVEYAGPGNFGLSPDGRHLAFVARGSDGIARLWLRSMDSLEVRPLPGSETSDIATPPPNRPPAVLPTMMSPSRFHEPPTATPGNSHRVCTRPPTAAARSHRAPIRRMPRRQTCGCLICRGKAGPRD